MVAVERVFFQVNVRTAIGGRPGQPGSRWPRPSPPGRGRRVHPEPGEAGGRRLGRRRQGAGGAHGAGAARARPAPRPGRRRRRRALALCHLAHARCGAGDAEGGGAVIGSLRGTLLDRGADEVTRRGRRRRLPGHGQPHHRGPLGDVGAEVFLWVHHHQREDAVTSTASPPSDERRASRRCSAPTASGPALALAILSVHTPGRPARGSWPTTTSAPCASCPASARRPRPPAHRPEVPARRPRPRRDAGGLPGPAVADGVGAAPADVRDALAGSATGPDEVREVMADCPTDGDAGALLRDALQRLAAARR